MIRSSLFKSGLMVLAAGLLFAGCSKTDCCGPELPEEPEKTKYVLITMSEQSLEKPGFATVFDELPSGNIVNNGPNSTQGFGFGGWRPYDNWLLKMFSMDANALGIERLQITADGKISSDKFIAADNTTNGSGNFVIDTETSGYYWEWCRSVEDSNL